jgi:putative transposase
MDRANRHYISGCVWHTTYRYHKKEFLLRLACDRRRWLQWFFEGRNRAGTCILNHAVTSNHIHLLIKDDEEREVIPQSEQLIAGRTGQEYIYGLRERDVSYNAIFAGENAGLRPKNTYFWNISD